ncbi:hypothetical protein TSAR_011875 [Trichomalopsis sarcophagae]|uniref:Uncharacterized protein n=1 Tax=Trichomalopsis sarcophagae TaxID=543379 RepID=A0A232EDU9_9HYME|nr:hypothetical protein TSAR_011875 [Trichomalopsis sarcophagae]
MIASRGESEASASELIFLRSSERVLSARLILRKRLCCPCVCYALDVYFKNQT